MRKNPISFRFHCRGEVNNPDSQESVFFHAFLSQVTNREVIQVFELDKQVDIEIEIGIITNNGIEVIPGFTTRISRYIQSKGKSGINLTVLNFIANTKEKNHQLRLKYFCK